MEFKFNREEQQMMLFLLDKEMEKNEVNHNYLVFLRQEVAINLMYRKEDISELRLIVKNAEELVNSNENLDIEASMFLFEMREKINEYLQFLDNGIKVK